MGNAGITLAHVGSTQIDADDFSGLVKGPLCCERGIPEAEPEDLERV